MKVLVTIFAAFSISIFSYAQKDNPDYDKRLADSLGANDYGMKSYIMVILKTGSNKTDNKQVIDSLFRGHMNNIEKMAAAGQLVVAGPFAKNDKAYRGIFILNVKTPEEANQLLAGDPALREKVLEAELLTWWGSAALPLYLQEHNRIEKKKF